MLNRKLICGITLAGLMSLGTASPQSIALNQATAAEIAQAVKGIGLARASAIVAYRQAHGPFKSLGELVKVRGISQKFIDLNLAQLQAQIKL